MKFLKISLLSCCCCSCFKGWDCLRTAASNGHIVQPTDDMRVENHGVMILTGDIDSFLEITHILNQGKVPSFICIRTFYPWTWAHNLQFLTCVFEGSFGSIPTYSVENHLLFDADCYINLFSICRGCLLHSQPEDTLCRGVKRQSWHETYAFNINVLTQTFWKSLESGSK